MTCVIESDAHLIVFVSHDLSSQILIGQAIEKSLDLGKLILFILTQVEELLPQTLRIHGRGQSG